MISTCSNALRRAGSVRAVTSKSFSGGILYNKCSHRHIGRFQPFEEKEITTRQVAAKPKHRVRCYLWGGTLSGALGRDVFVRPRIPEMQPRSFCNVPTRLFFGDSHEVSAIACGHGFTLFAARHNERKNNYQLFGTGVNTDSQLGLQEARKGDPMRLLTEPVPITFPETEKGQKTEISGLAAGRAHTIVVTKQGSVYGLGNNSLGQCGRAVRENEEYFGKSNLSRIDIPDEVVHAVCGLDHTLFLTKKGEIYACGWGADGQTGLGHYNNTGVPQKVKGDIEGVTIKSISSRADCVLALSDRGEVFGWGNNEYGQLLRPTTETQCHTPRHLRLSNKIKVIAAGGSACVVLDNDGFVHTWGYGILGLGPNVQHAKKPQVIKSTLFGTNELNPDCRVVSLVAALNDFVALNSDGHMFGWGRNQNGCLGLRHVNYQMFPMKVQLSAAAVAVAAGTDHMAALTKSYC